MHVIGGGVDLPRKPPTVLRPLRAVGRSERRDVNLPPRAMKRIFDLSFDLHGTSSYEGYFTHLSASWEGTLGWTRQELMSKPYLHFVHPDDVEPTRLCIARAVEQSGSPVVDFVNRYRTTDGRYRWLSWTVICNEDSKHFVVQDVTSRREVEIEHERAVRVMHAIVDSVADGIYVVGPNGRLMLVNPAGLRMLGYGSSDELVGRLPHEAFHHSRPDRSPYPIEECPMARVRSTGLAIHADEDVFWRQDGSALPISYSSEPIDLPEGVGCVLTFRDITGVQAQRNHLRAQVSELARFDDAYRALHEDRLVLYGQPIVDVASGATVKHELLLRMITPTGEVIEPGAFLPAAETYGLIHDIDRWVLTRGVEKAAAGRPVAVNLSASSLGDVEILLHIERELKRTGAAAELLTIEVTETAMMKDLQDGRRFANRLVALGCSFSLDDFGTGYGSLSYLRQLPVAYIKIDVTFVQAMALSEPDQSLVQAIVQIAHSVGKLTIAEGVEDEATLDLLRAFGVDLAQGYLLGKPVPLS